jgi:hypothetical protein
LIDAVIDKDVYETKKTELFNEAPAPEHHHEANDLDKDPDPGVDIKSGMTAVRS